MAANSAAPVTAYKNSRKTNITNKRNIRFIATRRLYVIANISLQAFLGNV